MEKLILKVNKQQFEAMDEDEQENWEAGLRKTGDGKSHKLCLSAYKPVNKDIFIVEYTNPCKHPTWWVLKELKRMRANYNCSFIVIPE